MMNKYYDVAAAREAISSIVPSISTPFLPNGDVDYKSLRGMVDFLIQNGAKTLLLTHGDSLLSILTNQEAYEVTRTVVEAADHRAMVIGCSKIWTLPEMLEFAETCAGFGCDMMIPFPPDWARHCTADTLLEYYKAVGKIMPVMILSCTNGGVPEAVYDRLKPEDGVVAVKDDTAYPYGIEALCHIRDKMAFLSGGTMKKFLTEVPYGADGYLSVFARCFPHVEKPFWQAVQEGRLLDAAKIPETYETPFFRWVAAHGINFDAGIRGMMEIAGLCNRFARIPYSTMTDEQMDGLRGFLTEKGII